MGLGSITGSFINPALLDPVFSPLLALPTWLAIAIIAFIVSVIVTLVYKFATDQDLMKELKGEMKELQAEMKELKSHPEKMSKVQGRFMKTNMKYMTNSMKSTLFTILPIILIFGWLNANLAFLPLPPGVPFDVTAKFATGTTGIVSLSTFPEGGLYILTSQQQEIVKNTAKWSLKGDIGEYVLDIVTLDAESHQAEVLITETPKYKPPVVKVKGSSLKTITIGNEKLVPARIFGLNLSWLWTYILFSIVFSMSLRRLMKLS